MSKTLYCRVDNGRVIEYPVTKEVIEKRNHPLSWYLPTTLQVEQTLDRADIQDVVYDIQVGVVAITVKHRPYSLEELLASFNTPGGTPKQVSTIKAEDIAFAVTLVGDYFENLLQQMVQAHGYSSIDTVIGRYSNSNNSTFRKEAEFVQRCLDETWEDLLAFFKNVKDGKVVVPVNISDIEKAVRPHTWPEE